MYTKIRLWLLPLLIVCSFVCSAEAKKTICVNMIVKNETRVIERCLGSVKPIIDYWVIVDTGSTDGTQEMIKKFMKDIPGELHERPWKNFAHNRNEALQLAKGKADYILIIDADEILQFEPGFKLPPLDLDYYYITTAYGGMRYERNQLIKNSLNWEWVGVLHEVLGSSQASTHGKLENVANVPTADGARSQDPRKFHKDAELLETALIDEPNNTRYVFYLAQSYKDAGEHESSLRNYEKRIAMGGWDQEVYWSMLQVARLEEHLKRPEAIVVNDYIKAYHYRPTRSEPLYNLAHYYRMNNNFPLAYLVAKKGITIPPSNDVLFVEKWIDDYGMLIELSVAAYYLGKFDVAKEASEKILARPNIPQDIRELAQRNLQFTVNAITNKNLTQRLLDKPTPVQ